MSMILIHKKLLLSSTFVLLTLSTLVQAQNYIVPELRTDQGCVYLPKSPAAYCYGGQTFNATGGGGNTGIGVSSDSLFVKLDLTRGINMSEIQNSWEQAGPSVGSNYYFSMEAIPELDKIFMDGGSGGSNTARFNTTIYSATTGSTGWSQNTPSRQTSPVTDNQATLGPDGNIIFVWGGIRDGDTGGLPAGSSQQFMLEMNQYIINENRWIIGDPVENSRARHLHKAVRVGSLIYYIGGLYPNPNGGAEIPAPMNQIPVFDTSSSTWSYPNTTGGTVPQPRARHTATLINNHQIAVFGGNQAAIDYWDIILDDYFYILDTRNGITWSSPMINASNGVNFDSDTGGGIRGHSAVFAGKFLFIVFGQTKSGNSELTKRGWILDTEATAWVTSMSALQPTDTLLPPAPSPTNVDNNPSPGTIAGAVVGGIIGCAIIAMVAFFFIRKKRRQQQQPESNDQYDLNNQYEDHTSDDLPPPPIYGEFKPHSQSSNIGQMLPSNPPYSSQENSRYSVEYTDNSTSQCPPSTPTNIYHIPEKPDGGIHQLRLLPPVKPDGA